MRAQRLLLVGLLAVLVVLLALRVGGFIECMSDADDRGLSLWGRLADCS